MMPLAKCHTPRPLVFAALSLSIYATSAGGQTLDAPMRLDPNCTPNPGSMDSCAHVVACIGDRDLFVGGSVGWEAGALYGRLSNGATCTGIWSNASGTAEFQCDDGQSGAVQYVLIDGPTGTAIGEGLTDAGDRVEAWSGVNVTQYLIGRTGEVTLQCGFAELPMS